MSVTAKLRIVPALTAVTAAGVWVMRGIPRARILLGLIWFGHALLLHFGIRTLKEENTDKEEKRAE